MYIYKVGLLKQEVFCLSGHDSFFAKTWVRKKSVTAQRENSHDSF